MTKDCLDKNEVKQIKIRETQSHPNTPAQKNTQNAPSSDAHLIERRDEFQRAVVRALENLQILLRRPAVRAQIRVHARKNLVLERALQQQLDDALRLRKHLRLGWDWVAGTDGKISVAQSGENRNTR